MTLVTYMKFGTSKLSEKLLGTIDLGNLKTSSFYLFCYFCEWHIHEHYSMYLNDLNQFTHVWKIGTFGLDVKVYLLQLSNTYITNDN